jgi:hypothetical protein
MFSLLSTLGGLLISGLPKLLDFFQNKSDQNHEQAMARIQSERELALAAQGFAAQAKIEEIRTDQVKMQTEATMTAAALDHDKTIIEHGSRWIANFIGTVRPTITYIFVLELVAINAFLTYYLFAHPTLITSIDDVIRYADIVFSPDEMSMLGGIIGFWFGSRSWGKK